MACSRISKVNAARQETERGMGGKRVTVESG